MQENKERNLFDELSQGFEDLKKQCPTCKQVTVELLGSPKNEYYECSTCRMIFSLWEFEE